MSHHELIANHSHCLSRRRFVASAGILTAAAWLAPRRLFAAGENIVLAARKRAETADMTVQALRANVSALIGSGGNIAVLTGGDGKVIIDSGYATSRAKITDVLAKMNPGPIKHLVNTHWHFDHTDGNEWMHLEGATILAHANTRKHLSTTTRVEDWDFTFPPSPPAAIPTEVFEKEKTLYLNSTAIALSSMAPATLTATYRPILLRLRSFTPAIPGGTAITRSSIIPPAAISKA
jgi:Metallo-beta-lactamase superfamily